MSLLDNYDSLSAKLDIEIAFKKVLEQYLTPIIKEVGEKFVTINARISDIDVRISNLENNIQNVITKGQSDYEMDSLRNYIQGELNNIREDMLYLSKSK